MTASATIIFVIAMFFLEISPGAGVAAVVSRTLGSGLAAGFGVMTGLIIGDMIFLGLSIVGLSLIASVMAPAFQIIKYVGGGYLIWLGYQTFVRAGSTVPVKAEPTGASWREVGIGLLVTLGNPKPILFYGALVPTFLDISKVGFGDYLILSSIIAAVAYTVLGGYAMAANRARLFLASSRAAKRLGQATGVMLASSGVLAVTR